MGGVCSLRHRTPAVVYSVVPMPSPTRRRAAVAPRSFLTGLFGSPLLLWSGLWLVAMFLTVITTLSLLKSDVQRARPPEPLPPETGDWQTAAGLGTSLEEDEPALGVNRPVDGFRPVESAPPRSSWPLPPWLALAIAALSATGSLVVTLLLRAASQGRRRRVRRLPPAPAQPSLPPARARRVPAELSTPAASSPATLRVGPPPPPAPLEPETPSPRPQMGQVIPLFPHPSTSLADELDLRRRYSLATLLDDEQP